MDPVEQKSLEIIRQAVDKILNINAVLKRRIQTEFDEKRELFFEILRRIALANTRSNLLYNDLRLDYSTYDESFYEIIEMLLLLSYGKECYELISYYVWERVNPDQSINNLMDLEGNEIVIVTPLDLWNIMVKVNPQLAGLE